MNTITEKLFAIIGSNENIPPEVKAEMAGQLNFILYFSINYTHPLKCKSGYIYYRN